MQVPLGEALPSPGLVPHTEGLPCDTQRLLGQGRVGPHAGQVWARSGFGRKAYETEWNLISLIGLTLPALGVNGRWPTL